MKNKKKKKQSRLIRLYPFLTGALLLAGAIVGYLLSGEADSGKPTVLAPGEAEVHFIDVGQGDAILLRTADGCVLVDAGPNGSEEVLKAYLKKCGVGRLLLCVFTHFDEDHIGGADAVLAGFGAERAWIPDAPLPEDNLSAARLTEAAGRYGCELLSVSGGERFTVGPAELTVLCAGGGDGEINETSVVLRVTVGERVFLLQGDAEEKTEKALLASLSPAELRCDVLKLGHHGARTGTCPEWLDALTPQYAVISAAHGNSYGHPHASTLERLEARSVTVCRTDEDGTVVFFTDGEQLIRK